MTKRLTQLEAINKSLKLEIREKSQMVIDLQDENDTLLKVTSAESVKEMDTLKTERDTFKKKCEEMTKFL